MAWRKPDPDVVALFERIAPGPPEAESRKMFGCPARFVGGNMLAGVWQESIILRLGENERTRFLAIQGSRHFEPSEGRRMREYVVVPPRMMRDIRALRRWMARAFDFASSLPAKR